MKIKDIAPTNEAWTFDSDGNIHHYAAYLLDMNNVPNEVVFGVFTHWIECDGKFIHYGIGDGIHLELPFFTYAEARDALIEHIYARIHKDYARWWELEMEKANDFLRQDPTPLN